MKQGALVLWVKRLDNERLTPAQHQNRRIGVTSEIKIASCQLQIIVKAAIAPRSDQFFTRAGRHSDKMICNRTQLFPTRHVCIYEKLLDMKAREALVPPPR